MSVHDLFAFDRAVAVAKSRARCGVWDGRMPTRYFRSCRHALHVDPEVVCLILFTRDQGYHSSGWWKNPDYERCYHLSASFFAIAAGGPPTPLPRDERFTDRLLEALFGDDRRYLWCEPPYSPEGKARDVWHYRLFCDPAWEAIKPRGEVYGKELTEAGWLSFSDVQAAKEKARKEAAEGGVA